MTVQIESKIIAVTGSGSIPDTEEQRHLTTLAATRQGVEYKPNAEALVSHNHVVSMAQVSTEVSDEMVAQLQKWGIQNHPSVTLAATSSSEEWYIAGLSVETAKEETNEAATDGYLCWPQILHEDCAETMAECIALAIKPNDPEVLARLRKELIQVSAVAQSWIQSIDRNQK